MKRALIFSAVLVIALMALTLPEAAFPQTAEAWTPPAKVDKPTIKIRANGFISTNWDPVPGRGVKYVSHFESDKGVRRILGSGRSTYGFVSPRNLEAGNRYRVRVISYYCVSGRFIYGESSEWSDWSDVYGAPAKVDKPTIRIRASGKIGMNWDPVDGATKYIAHLESNGGRRYKFRVNGGSTYGIINQRYLTDGQRYRARLIAKNAAGLWSEWSEWSDWTSPYGRVLSK